MNRSDLGRVDARVLLHLVEDLQRDLRPRVRRVMVAWGPGPSGSSRSSSGGWARGFQDEIIRKPPSAGKPQPPAVDGCRAPAPLPGDWSSQPASSADPPTSRAPSDPPRIAGLHPIAIAGPRPAVRGDGLWPGTGRIPAVSRSSAAWQVMTTSWAGPRPLETASRSESQRTGVGPSANGSAQLGLQRRCWKVLRGTRNRRVTTTRCR